VATYNGTLVPDEKAWARSIVKIHKTLAYMEQTKYLEPKFSYSFDDLAVILKSSGSVSNCTKISRISAVERMTAKKRHFKSVPPTPKESPRKNKYSQKARLKSLAVEPNFTSLPDPRRTFHANDRKQVMSSRKERVAQLLSDAKKQRMFKRFNNTSLMQDKIKTDKAQRVKKPSSNKAYRLYNRKLAKSNVSYHTSQEVPTDNSRRRHFNSTRGGQTINRDYTTKPLNIALRDSKFSKGIFNGGIKPIKLKHSRIKLNR